MVVDPPDPVEFPETEEPEEKGGMDLSDGDGDAGFLRSRRCCCCSEETSELLRERPFVVAVAVVAVAAIGLRLGLYLGASLYGTETERENEVR